MYIGNFKRLVMTRREVLDRMPKEIQDRVYDNMIHQGEWKKVDKDTYEDEIDFIMGAFVFHESFEPRGYWEDYADFLFSFKYLVTQCIGDE